MIQNGYGCPCFGKHTPGIAFLFLEVTTSKVSAAQPLTLIRSPIWRSEPRAWML